MTNTTRITNMTNNETIIYIGMFEESISAAAVGCIVLVVSGFGENCSVMAFANYLIKPKIFTFRRL